MKSPTKPLRLNALSAALMMRAMLDGPCTVKELIEVTGLARQSVWRYLRALHKVGAIHIAEWESDALDRPQIPAFSMGVANDKARPKQPRARKSRRKQRYARDVQRAMIQMTAGAMAGASN